ncbi:MAG: glycerophosphodiester phosphodiesterase family protein [Proteobacteria bacterium]|nr:glycerophosphodiester phosphodiesterase family protein [Pseudomonadota bacterium]
MMTVIGHRGAPHKAPENSLSGVKQAAVEGAERIEVDLQLSADGHIYICHDDLTSRTTSHNLLISKSSSHELAKVHLENGETLPTFTALLELLTTPALQHLAVSCEIKPSDVKIISALAKEIAQNKHFSDKRLVLSSLSSACLNNLAQNPSMAHIKRALLWKTDITPTTISEIIHGLKESQSHILHPLASIYKRPLAEMARVYNLEVYTWSQIHDNELEDNCALWHHLLEMEVDGHCTNYPLELKRFLRQKKLQCMDS